MGYIIMEVLTMKKIFTTLLLFTLMLSTTLMFTSCDLLDSIMGGNDACEHVDADGDKI